MGECSEIMLTKESSNQLIKWLEDITNDEFKLVGEYYSARPVNNTDAEELFQNMVSKIFKSLSTDERIKMTKPNNFDKLMFAYVVNNYSLYSGNEYAPVPSDLEGWGALDRCLLAYETKGKFLPSIECEDLSLASEPIGMWEGKYGQDHKELVRCIIEWVKSIKVY